MLLLNKGGFQHELGLNDSAIATDRQCLAAMTALFGPAHMNVAVVQNNLGEVYYDKGDYKEAMKAYLASKEIFAKYWAENDPNFSASHLNIGKTEMKLGRHKRAEELLTLALKLKQGQQGAEAEDLVEYYDCLTELYKAMGRKKDAEKYAGLGDKLRKHRNYPGSTGTILNKSATDD